MKLRKRSIALCAALLAVLLILAVDSRLAVRRYTIDADDISAPVRIALVTDLHSCRYGEGQQDLISALEQEAPDLVLLGGDIFDDRIGDENAERFITSIAGDYPCYYVTGNHEHWSGAAAFAAKMDILEKHGVPVLSGACEVLQINGETLYLCGVDDPDAFEVDKEQAYLSQLDAVLAQLPDGALSLLLAHRPEYFEAYCTRGFDLVFSGHAHGGQWRLPGLLNGLFAPNQGLFPRYAGGQYDLDNTTMIVSRGLARESTRVPRIFNRPELVMIDLT